MKIIYWLFVSFILFVVADHAWSLISSGPHNSEAFCINRTCLAVVPYLVVISNLNLLIGVAAIFAISLKSKYGVPLLVTYLLIHVISDAPQVYYNFMKFGPVWPESPYLWEAIRAGWPIVALGVMFIPGVLSRLKHNKALKNDADNPGAF